MSDHEEQTPPPKWRTLPPHTPLADTVASQEVPPKPQVISEPGNLAQEEATRYPA